MSKIDTIFCFVVFCRNVGNRKTGQRRETRSKSRAGKSTEQSRQELVSKVTPLPRAPTNPTTRPKTTCNTHTTGGEQQKGSNSCTILYGFRQRRVYTSFKPQNPTCLQPRQERLRATHYPRLIPSARGATGGQLSGCRGAASRPVDASRQTAARVRGSPTPIPALFVHTPLTASAHRQAALPRVHSAPNPLSSQTRSPPELTAGRDGTADSGPGMPRKRRRAGHFLVVFLIPPATNHPGPLPPHTASSANLMGVCPSVRPSVPWRHTEKLHAKHSPVFPSADPLPSPCRKEKIAAELESPNETTPDKQKKNNARPRKERRRRREPSVWSRMRSIDRHASARERRT